MMLPRVSPGEGAVEPTRAHAGKPNRRGENDPPVNGFPAMLFALVTPPAAAQLDAAAPAETVEATDDAAAVVATGTGAVADVTMVNRSLNGLNPEFRARLGRVIGRMRREFGHRVEVTETVRTQARQEYLYAQGRSRPGPVVTWTLDSNHAAGRAADVIIDDSYGNPAAYQRLAQVAAEEGLRTLGPMDPGHLELPEMAAPLAQRPDPASGHRQPLARTDVGYALEGGSPREHGIVQGAVAARVARVAEIARVAPVAQVAEVARVAAPGGAEEMQGDTSGDGESMAGDSNGAQARLAETGMARSTPGLAPASSFAATMADGIAAPGGADAIERLARILEMKDGATSAGVDHMILRLDNGAGGEDRIRVDLRGSGLGATIDAASAADAERLLSRLPELKLALERHGLDAESLKVRSAAIMARDAVPTLDATRTVLRPDGSAEGTFDRERGRSRGHDEAGEKTGHSHSRSRREQNGGHAP